MCLWVASDTVVKKVSSVITIESSPILLTGTAQEHHLGSSGMRYTHDGVTEPRGNCAEGILL